MGLIFNGKCTSKKRLDGKTVVVTGCNTGIGRYTVQDLYARGARVIMACRDLKKAEEAINHVTSKLQNAQGTGELMIKHLDLASFASVRKCANEILEEQGAIHLLINNAGVMMAPHQITEDGYELHFATNHLSHFLFTLLLLPRILKSAPARIVNVASLAHILGDLCLDDLNLEKSYSPARAYGRSKLANGHWIGDPSSVVHLSSTLERSPVLESCTTDDGSSIRNAFDLKQSSTGVTVYSLHPGVVDTDLSRHLDSAIFPGSKWFYQKLGWVFMKTPQQGAQTTLYCALDEQAGKETGLYYDDCKVKTPSAKAQNEELAKKLWDLSVNSVHIEDYNAFKAG